MLRRLAGFFARVAERWTPDPLVIAVFLTGVAFVSALLFTEFTGGQAVDAWGHSYWELLRFTAQMILILALGHVCSRCPYWRSQAFICATSWATASSR